MADHDIALMAHLMRRAGFGAQYDELEARAAKGYEATVEELPVLTQSPVPQTVGPGGTLPSLIVGRTAIGPNTRNKNLFALRRSIQPDE